MDPVTAIGLAAAVVQFVDFGSEIVSEAKQIHQAGSSSAISDLERVTRDLVNANKKLKDSLSRTPAPAQVVDSNVQVGCIRILTPWSGRLIQTQALEALASQCIVIGDKLLRRLGPLRTDGPVGKFKSLRQAVRVVLGKSGTDALSKRLDTFKAELQFRVLVDLRTNIDIRAAECDRSFRDLDEKNRAIAQKILDGQVDFALTVNRRIDRFEGHQVARFDRILGAFKTIEKHLAERPGMQEFVYTFNPRTIRNRVLAALHFKQIRSRFNDVPEAHKQTFEWVWQAEKDKPWDKLGRWIESGGGCYWLSGKAGSGKSTLMKWICDHKRTRQALSHWAGDHRLVTASFFFWNAGTALQKSQKGLLRSILYDILLQHPDLIEYILPRMYSSMASTQPPVDEEPTLADLMRGLETLAAMSRNPFRVPFRLPLKTCLFVDGIDEFEEDPTQLAELFLSLSSFPNVKCVIAGRPITACEVTFAHCPTLRLQDLTYLDIKRYVDDKVSGHKLMKALMDEKPAQAARLVHEIVTKASGVFLWVMLVVRSLQTGLQNSDDLNDLKQRLEELPPELEALYRHMFARMDKLYRQQAAQLFFIMVHYSTINPDESLTTLTLSYIEDQGAAEAIDTPQSFFKPQKLIAMGKKWDKRVTSRCCGLLETQYGTWPDTRQYGNVQFLHRTVVEFLHQPTVWDEILQSVQNRAIDIDISFCLAALLQVKQEIYARTGSELLLAPATDLDFILSLSWTDLEAKLNGALSARRVKPHCAVEGTVVYENLSPGQTEIMKIAKDFFVHMRSYGNKTLQPQADLIRKMEETLSLFFLTFSKQPSGHWSLNRELRFSRETPSAGFEDLLPFAIEIGLVAYVAYRFRKSGVDISTVCAKPPLQLLLNTDLKEPWRAPLEIYHDMAAVLFAHGANPNDKYRERTGWELVLYRCLRAADDQLEDWARLMELFVMNGADISLRVGHPKDDEVDLNACEIVMERFLPAGSELTMEMEEVEDDWTDLQIEARTRRHRLTGAAHIESIGIQLIRLLVQKGGGPPGWKEQISADSGQNIPNQNLGLLTLLQRMRVSSIKVGLQNAPWL